MVRAFGSIREDKVYAALNTHTERERKVIEWIEEKGGGEDVVVKWIGRQGRE